MFKHIVCTKFKNKEDAKEVAKRLNTLVGKVETLRSLETGVDVLNSSRSYDLVLITTFDDIAGYRAYDTHPEHEKVRAFIKTVRESSVTVDYEF